MKRIKVKRFTKFQLISFIIILALVLLPLSITLGRFVYNKVLDFYFSTKDFYFESDKLTRDGASYLLEHWNGVDPYNIVINLSSLKNNKLKSNNDITYEISYNCSSTVICNSNKDDGVIYASTNTDSFIITMTPNATFKDNDVALVNITAKSTSPYTKTLKAQFKLVVGTYGLSYEIDDSSNSPYLELRVTNTLDYYTVKEAFLDYKVGDQIDEVTYSNLSSQYKDKCASALVVLSFDPNIIYVDSNSTTYLNSYNIKSTKINNFDYISGFTFKIDSTSSSVVKFYKKDAKKDYSDDLDIINVSYQF